MLRDQNGTRGPVPGTYRAHDWQTARLLREAAERYRAHRRAIQWTQLSNLLHAQLRKEN